MPEAALDPTAVVPEPHCTPCEVGLAARSEQLADRSRPFAGDEANRPGRHDRREVAMEDRLGGAPVQGLAEQPGNRRSVSVPQQACRKSVQRVAVLLETDRRGDVPRRAVFLWITTDGVERVARDAE